MSPRRLGIIAALTAIAAVIAARLLKAAAEEPAPEAASSSPSSPAEAAAPPPPVPAEDQTVEGYCVKERKKVAIAEPRAVKTKNGRDAVRGKCPDCGASIFRMGKLPGA